MCATTQVMAQKNLFFEYTVTKDGKLFNVETDKLNVSDSNSVIEILVKSTSALLSDISWGLSSVEVTSVADRRPINMMRLGSATFRLNMLGKLILAVEERPEENIIPNARVVVEIKKILGSKGDISDAFELNDIIILKVEHQ